MWNKKSNKYIIIEHYGPINQNGMKKIEYFFVVENYPNSA